jgi:hypothetical protein
VYISIPLLVLVGVSLAACASPPVDASQAALETVRVSQLDKVHRHPEADFTRWNTLYVDTPRIEYAGVPRTERHHRKPEDFQLTERDLERLREQLVKAVESGWGETPGWTVVDAPGPDTLVLQTTLADYYLHAPIRDDYPGRTSPFVRESSRFALEARLLAPDGKLLLESSDRRVTGERGGGPMMRFEGVLYWSHVYRDFHRWARQLQPALASS